MFGALYFGAGPFAGAIRKTSLFSVAAALSFSTAGELTARARLQAAAGLRFSTVANFVGVPFQAKSGLSFSTHSTLTIPRRYGVGIAIGNQDVTARVRVQGLTIHDILNDAPSTCSLVIEGDAPAVGQMVRIEVGSPGRLLFAGAVQTVEQTYTLQPKYLAWAVTAIDDTGRANARRPFGAWLNTSATTIAQTITATYAPGFWSGGIAANLPTVSIVFDGADLFIACLARLANAIGGYCKIEDGTVYLFLTDTAEPPDPVDLAHPPLNDPSITVNTDASQLRTRVYGKGYGENIPSDILPGETLIPVQDGVAFPPLGGTMIASVTPEGAQSEKLAYASVQLRTNGTLVGPGTRPGNAPLLVPAAAGTPGIESGYHEYAYVYVTGPAGNDRTLPGPRAGITVGYVPDPTTAPTAGTPTAGGGADEGTHEYVVAFVTTVGETLPSPISNYVVTSAAVGQLPLSEAPIADPALVGTGIEDGAFEYGVTFVNAQGETSIGAVASGNGQTTGLSNPVEPGGVGGTIFGTFGGNLTSANYSYYVTVTTTRGETPPGASLFADMRGGGNVYTAVAVPIPIHSDPRVTGRKIYRFNGFGGSAGAHLIATISNNTLTSYFDTAADASILSGAPPPTVNTTAEPYNRLPIRNIQTGPDGTTARKLYRRHRNTSEALKLVTTISGNTQTTYTDVTPTASLGGPPPVANTTGTAVQVIPVSNIPIGPASTTARALYRRFNGAGGFRLVTTIANNTQTSYVDAIPNSALGAGSLGASTAFSNRVAVTFEGGPATVTYIEIFRTAVGSSDLRFLYRQTGAAAGTFLDTIPDASLGLAHAPTEDTSGLAQPAGQVNPGAPILPVASSAPFRDTGGWVEIAGNQVVRYTGKAGSTLTGLPASGPGAISTPILFGSQAIPAPMLVGVTGVTRQLYKGAAIHLWIQRDDVAAQVEHAARTGGDGVVEYLITDTRRGEASLIDRCEADLALFARPIVTVSYATRDLKTKSGKPVRINLPSQHLNQTLTIQEVTIDQIDLARRLAPRFTVTASTVRFSLEDVLRRIIAGESKDQ